MAEEEEVECGSGGGDGEGPARRSVGEFEKGLTSADGERAPFGEEKEELGGGSMNEEVELDALE